MRITLATLQKMAQEGSRIAMLTCYDASFAAVLEAAGVDSLLIGDSLGNVLQGHESTLPVTLRDMVYHTQCVARGSKRAFIVGDMPFATFQVSPQEAFHNAAELMAAGAHMVKIEGGRPMLDTIEFLTDRGVPVCGHLGLTPQSVHALGGYRVQGRDAASADQLLADARALDEAGAALLVLELMPSTVAGRVTAAVSMPTIGIGAGPDVSGQVLVLHDMLNVYPGRKPRFVRNFMDGAPDIAGAVRSYVAAVKDRSFPAPEHGY